MVGPVGTVAGAYIGGIIGGAVAGWATNYVMTTPIQQMLPNVGSFLGSAVFSEFGPLGMIAGSQLGGMAGGGLANLITGPVCTQVSIKDFVVDGLTPVMQSADDMGASAVQQASSIVSAGYQSASSAIDNFLNNTSAAIQNAPVPSFSVF
jgi:hypothetical protein